MTSGSHQLPPDHEAVGNIIDLEERTWTETFRWRRLMLTERAVLLSDLPENDPRAFEAKIGGRWSLIARRRAIPYAMLTRITRDGHVMQFDWIGEGGKDRKARVRFKNAHASEAVTGAIEEVKHWQPHQVPNKAVRFLVGRGIVLGLILLVMWLLLVDARHIANGEAIDLSGGHKATTLLLWKLAELLGAQGTWLVGGAGACILVALTFAQWRKREPLTVWR
jgi:hypothetical protein